MRREETSKFEKQLSAANESWKERQQLFQEAHHNQLRAVARQGAILEENLRKEFEGTLTKVTQDHCQKLKNQIESSMKEAEVIKLEAVYEARQEEQARASEEALIVAARVADEKKQYLKAAEETRIKFLEKQKEKLDVEHVQALKQQKELIEQDFKSKLSRVSKEYDSRLDEFQERFDKQLALSQQLESDLQAMTNLKNSWESKYKNIREEFSDFIDKLPGFRGEFILRP